MLSVLIYGIASAAQATETGAGWGTEEVGSYIRFILKVMRRDNVNIRTFQNLFLFTLKKKFTVKWKFSRMLLTEQWQHPFTFMDKTM